MGAPRRFDYDAALRLYVDERVSAREIGRRLGVSGVAVARALKLSGLTDLDPGRKPNTTVRETELRCTICGQWKPDRAFPRNRNETYRRSRHTVCRDDQSALRQQARLRRRVPCSNCGEPRNHDLDGNRGSGLCRPCYLTRAARSVS